MEITTHLARITAPISYATGGGRKQHIPVGPCMVESHGDQAIDIVWGERGQRSAVLPLAEAEVARNQGQLVLID